MTTPRIPSGIPWWVTQSMESSDSRRSSERRRTIWTPGTISVPLPVTILNPRLSDTESLGVCSRNPEIISASLGSATLHIILKMTKRTSSAPRTAPAMIPAMACLLRGERSHTGDDDRAGREVLHHDDAAPDRDRLIVVGGVGVAGLAASTHLDHDLTQAAGGDGAGDSTHLPDHLVVGHGAAQDSSSLGGSPAAGRSARIRANSASIWEAEMAWPSSASSRSPGVDRSSRAPEASSSSMAPARDCMASVLSSARCTARPMSPISSEIPDRASPIFVWASAAV